MTSHPAEILASLLASLRAAVDAAARAALISALLRDSGAVGSLARWSTEEPYAYEAAMLDLGAVAGAGSLVGRLRAALAKAAAALPPSAQDEQHRDEDVAPEAIGDPTLEALAVPDGWFLDGRGVWYTKEVEGETVIRRATSTPIAVVEVLESARDGTERVRLRWRRGGAASVWTDAILPRSSVRDARKVIALADLGVDVGSTTARNLVAWLSVQEAHNDRDLPRSVITDRMGWQGAGGGLGYLAGADHVAHENGKPSRRCVLDVSDPGRAQLAAAMEPSGNLNDWRRAASAALGFPSVMLALYASLASPFLGVVPEAPSVILDWSGATSRGKTTTLAVAASVWGHPRKGHHLVHSWDATPAYIEGAADCLRHLPLCLDDTRDAKDPASLERLIYTYAGESGRGRARPDGLRASLEVRGVLLSTGEQPITSFGTGGGARARSLCLRGWPLGDNGHAIAVDLVARLSEHRGLAGPAVVRWLVANSGRWGGIRKAWRDHRAAFAAKAQSNVGQRLGAVLALLKAGSFAAHDLLELPRPSKDPLDFAAAAADMQAEEADRAAAAVTACYAWACAHEAEFWGREHRDRSTQEARQPSLGWAGRWTRSGWDEIAWVPGCIERVLKYEGFRPEEILSAWVDRGWLQGDGRNRGRKRAIGEYGETPRCLVLPRAVIEQVIGATDE